VILPAPVQEYLATLTRVPHPQLDAVRVSGDAQGLPIVDARTGALLHALVRLTGARRALEIGTAIGYSSLWMATALPADGTLITLERDRARATEARRHFDAAGLGERITVMIGDASQYLHKIAGPFDLIFQDGDKASYSPLLDRLIALLRPSGLLVTDNVLWSGEVIPGFVEPPQRRAADTAAIAAYNQKLAADERLYTTFVPVGDGVALSVKQGGRGTWGA
jgi:predicted O-methyltransferase YrrM